MRNELSDPLSTETMSTERAVASGVDDAYTLLEFISQLGIAMSAAGQPVSDEQRLAHGDRAGVRSGDARSPIVPNLLFVKLGGRESSALDLAAGWESFAPARPDGGGLRSGAAGRTGRRSRRRMG